MAWTTCGRYIFKEEFTQVGNAFWFWGVVFLEVSKHNHMAK